MKYTYTLLIGIVVIVVLVIVGGWYVFSKQSVDSQRSDTNDTQTATTTEGNSQISDVNNVQTTTTIEGDFLNKEGDTLSKQEGESTPEESSLSDSPSEKGNVTISISTSPYSVYIGFATSTGTSSESVLEQEVSEVVIGYEWEALPGSAKFATVDLPEWDLSEDGRQKEYEVHVWDRESDSYVFLGRYPSSEETELPRKGLFIATQRFKVTDIDPELRICPGDRSFLWDMRFTAEGAIGLIRTPLTQSLPQGETCHMQ